MKISYVFFAAFLLLSACSKHHNPAPTAPSKATYIFPTPDAICTKGTPLNDSISEVDFYWHASTNVTNYVLHLKNLQTNISTPYPTSNSYEVIDLKRNTPYSWSITSQNTITNLSTESDTWKFFMEGVGVVTYAPFPADLLSPTYGQNIAAGQIALQWTGGDVDATAKLTYDVYLGTSTSPPLLLSGVKNMFLDNVTVTAGNTYYWKVVTNDAVGNTAESEVYQFVVN